MSTDHEDSLIDLKLPTYSDSDDTEQMQEVLKDPEEEQEEESYFWAEPGICG